MSKPASEQADATIHDLLDEKKFGRSCNQLGTLSGCRLIAGYASWKRNRRAA